VKVRIGEALSIVGMSPVSPVANAAQATAPSPTATRTPTAPRREAGSVAVDADQHGEHGGQDGHRHVAAK
jgi:hypothetical protein